MYTSRFITTPALRDKIGKIVLQGTSFPTTSSLWLALFTGLENSGGVERELTGAGYTRMQIPFAGSGSTVRTNADIVFPTATANWSPISTLGIMTSSGSSGSRLFTSFVSQIVLSPIGALTAYTVLKGDRLTIKQEELNVSLDTAISTASGSKVGYSQYLAENLLDHIIFGSAYTSPGTNVYLALYNKLPDKNDSGGIEVSAYNYNRLKISGSSWIESSWGDTSYATTPLIFYSGISLPFCTETDVSWGVIAGMCLRDAASGGNQLLRTALNYSAAVVLGDSFSISPGDVQVAFG